MPRYSKTALIYPLPLEKSEHDTFIMLLGRKHIFYRHDAYTYFMKSLRVFDGDDRQARGVHFFRAFFQVENGKTFRIKVDVCIYIRILYNLVLPPFPKVFFSSVGAPFQNDKRFYTIIARLLSVARSCHRRCDRP